jgi:hypothetical protein
MQELIVKLLIPSMRGITMSYGNRDMGINHIKARKNHTCYGMGLGIIILDDPYPGFPGDVRNASAFPYPIQYEIAIGVDNHTLVWEKDKSPCLEPIKKAARNLESMGCRAIAAECGYFAYFQKQWIFRHLCLACCRCRLSNRSSGLRDLSVLSVRKSDF